jgi:hypothetical protein
MIPRFTSVSAGTSAALLICAPLGQLMISRPNPAMMLPIPDAAFAENATDAKKMPAAGIAVGTAVIDLIVIEQQKSIEGCILKPFPRLADTVSKLEFESKRTFNRHFYNFTIFFRQT